MTDIEFVELRAEVQRLLAAALEADQHHHDEMNRRDKEHIDEMDRRDRLHVDEMSRRDHLHTDEQSRRDQRHVEELERRDQVGARQRDDFQHALQSRDIIGQAKGIIMASMGSSADEAFSLLTKQSQAENRKLVEIATELAARTQRKRPT